LELLFDRALAEQQITYRTDVSVQEVRVSNGADRLEVRVEANGREEILHTDYVLFAIGREPNLDFLAEEVRARKNELVESGRLYFVGDVKNELYRQVAIAAGDGLRAAMQIYQRISK
jgi:thioredoxin reductase